MKKLQIFGLLIGGILLVQFSQAQFSLNGEFRPRTEFNHGYKSLAGSTQDPSTYTSQRSRLNFLYSSENLLTKITLQDVRLWGSQKQLVGNEDYATSIHEAWAEVFLVSKISIKAGRQELVYDDHRIFGNVGWAQQARSHDVAIFKYEDDLNIHIGIAHHEDGDLVNNFYTGPDAYKNMQFLWLNKKTEESSLSFLFLNNGKPLIEKNGSKSKYSQTIGGRFTQKIHNINLSTNIYYQTGKDVKTVIVDNEFEDIVRDISALNFLIELSFKNGLLAGYEYLSGTDYNETTKLKSFAPLYGTNHKFNGFMDYFYVGNHIGSVGLNDAYIKYKFTKNKVGINADLHYFASTAAIAPDTKNYLGTELDLSISWTIQQNAKIVFGLSKMFASESMEILKGGDRNEGQNWAYIMLSVTPTFVK